MYGSIVPLIQEAVARDIDELVGRLLEEAAVIWRDASWRRYDDREANCTIQMYRCSREAQRRNSLYGLLAIQIEYVMPTRGMLDAAEDATGMVRPDMRISVGDVGRVIECKRLSLSDGRPRSYVYDGMARFVCGAYASESDVEYMIGYLQADEVSEVVAAVNRHVDRHPSMGGSHALQRSVDGPIGVAHRFTSTHSRKEVEPFRIRHHILDVRLAP